MMKPSISLLYSSLFFCFAWVTLTFASELPNVGDADKCGRDCAYYIAAKFAINASLQEIDNDLKNQTTCSMQQLQALFRKYGLHCKSYSFGPNQYDSYFSRLSHNGKVYALGAFPKKDNVSVLHFMVILGGNATTVHVYDPSLNDVRTLDLFKLKEKVASIPVLLVSDEEVTPNFALMKIQVLLDNFINSPYVIVFPLITLLYLVLMYSYNSWNHTPKSIANRSKSADQATLFL